MHFLSSRSLALVLVAVLLACTSGCKSSAVQAAGGDADISGPLTFNAIYQVRNPRICAKVTSPPTLAQATIMVQCANESDTTGSSSPAIWLATDVQIEMGSPRPYIPGTDDRQNLDVTAKIYPIRGQGTRWSCGPAASYAPGENCMKWLAGPGGQGACWKTSFGDWKCDMTLGSTNIVNRIKGPTTY